MLARTIFLGFENLNPCKMSDAAEQHLNWLYCIPITFSAYNETVQTVGCNKCKAPTL